MELFSMAVLLFLYLSINYVSRHKLISKMAKKNNMHKKGFCTHKVLLSAIR